MGRERFDRLRVLRLEGESRNGCAEICQGPDGTRWVRLRILSPDCQREVLEALDGDVPVRLEGDALELLLPWHGGIPLREWLFERRPGLGQRRDACLALLGQLIEQRGKLPPCLTALAARTENLTVENTDVSLQYLPELRYWEPGMGEGQAVRAVASVLWEILTSELDRPLGRRFPEELELLRRRRKGRGYSNWGQLQRDVAAIPDELPRVRPVWAAWVRRARNLLSLYGGYLLRGLAALLLAAALLSLAAEYRRRSGDETAWRGMYHVGDQDLRSGEGGG